MLLGALAAYLLASLFYSRLSVAAGIALTLVLVALAVFIIHCLEFWLYGEPEQFTAVLVRRLVFTLVLFVYLFRQALLNQRLKQRESAELRAQVQALQSRIRPHFLFNSMNVIASLIPVDAEKAEQVVEDLSELFRASLQQAGSFVSVSEELELCRRYINIETLRLGDRLKVSWDVEAPPRDAEMPLLMIQPLIENAVYHGIQPLSEGGIIHVNLVFHEGQMVLTMTNPLKELDKAADEATSKNYSPKPPAKGNSIAIDKIRQRLEVVYGENATLVTKQQGNRFKTTLTCPAVPKFL
jgi:two-component system sensor histidine kinase AlgZ